MASRTAGKPAPKKKPTPAAAVKKRAGIATPERRRSVDWAAVERDFRTAKFTLRELGDKYGVSHNAVGKKARDKEWQKDLSAEIRQATNAKLVSDLVAKEVAKGSQQVASTVLVAAEVNKQVILAHRAGLSRITEVKRMLLLQIEQAAENMPDLADVIEMVRSPDDNGIDRANDALRKAMGRSALVDDLKKLADVDEKVRKGEREAFALDIDPSEADKSADTGPKMTDTQLAVRISNLMARAKAEK